MLNGTARRTVPRRDRGERASSAPRRPARRSSFPIRSMPPMPPARSAADCEPVYLPATADNRLSPRSRRPATRCSHARSQSFSPRPPIRRARSPTRALSCSAHRARAEVRLHRVQRRMLFRDLSRRAPAGMLEAAGPTSPTWWYSTRSPSARTCPGCASASSPATAVPRPLSRAAQRRGAAGAGAGAGVAVAAYGDEAHVEGTASSMRPNSISPTRSSVTATATAARPADSSCGSTCRAGRRRGGGAAALARGGAARAARALSRARPGRRLQSRAAATSGSRWCRTRTPRRRHCIAWSPCWAEGPHDGDAARPRV